MGEYISREEAIKELREVYENEYPTASGDFDEYASHDVPNVLRNMPAADVQPVKHGRWDGYICSECNVCADYFISGDFYFDEKPNFCPNCGARMDGDNNA